MNKTSRIAMLLIAAAVSNGCGMEQVDEGFRGLKTRFGKLEGEPLTPGLYFYNPITQDIFEMEVRETKLEGQESCFTSDTQTVLVDYAITYYPKPTAVGRLYSQFGKEWAEKIVLPSLRSGLKDALGHYRADDLVSKREAASAAALDALKKDLENRDVVVTRLELTNLDFNDAYEHAIEAKVVATQRAIEAKNKTVQVDEESKQTVLQAKAEAESMRIRSQALSQNKNLIMYEAVQKWDGAYPQVMLGSGSMPMLDLRGLTSKNMADQ